MTAAGQADTVSSILLLTGHLPLNNGPYLSPTTVSNRLILPLSADEPKRNARQLPRGRHVGRRLTTVRKANFNPFVTTAAR